MFRTKAARDNLYNRFVNLLAFDEFEGDSLEEKFEAMANQSKYETLTEDELLELREMGASKEFVMMAQYDDGERNSVRENAERALEQGEKPHFGHFGDYMWEGDLYHAMERADGTNTRIMQEVFGLPYINASAREQTDTHTPMRGFKVNDDGRVVYK